jgi:hypothetical protein
MDMSHAGVIPFSPFNHFLSYKLIIYKSRASPSECSIHGQWKSSYAIIN